MQIAMVDPLEEFVRRATQEQSAARAEDDEILDAEILEEESAEANARAGENLARHMLRRMDRSEIESHLRQLGRSIDPVDERMETNLGQVFEHALGELARETGVAGAATGRGDQGARKGKPEPGLDLRSLLDSRDDLRKAIVLSEIIQRPEHRWE